MTINFSLKQVDAWYSKCLVCNFLPAVVWSGCKDSTVSSLRVLTCSWTHGTYSIQSEILTTTYRQSAMEFQKVWPNAQECFTHVSSDFCLPERSLQGLKGEPGKDGSTTEWWEEEGIETQCLGSWGQDGGRVFTSQSITEDTEVNQGVAAQRS